MKREIERWRRSDSKMAIHEFIGMSYTEYEHWVTGQWPLRQIVGV